MWFSRLIYCYVLWIYKFIIITAAVCYKELYRVCERCNFNYFFWQIIVLMMRYKSPRLNLVLFQDTIVGSCINNCLGPPKESAVSGHRAASKSVR